MRWNSQRRLVFAFDIILKYSYVLRHFNYDFYAVVVVVCDVCVYEVCINILTILLSVPCVVFSLIY